MEKCRTRRRRRRGADPGRWRGGCVPLFFNVNSGVSTVHVAEQWRHGAEGEGEGEEGEGEGEREREGLVISLLQDLSLLLCCNTVATKAAPSCFDHCCISNTKKGGAHEQ